ncbi:MAG: glycosyltransferase family 9 protein [Betaproteobacteria bacterium]|nr:glycosyltransferase family 9 protein [Betaproteobacteria bacterium]MDH3436665.1 glycosyltransferase family 9 protein [Betaproteobacteria bacterium]
MAPKKMRPKLLAILFKYLGDVVVATPALRALRQAFPQWELHVLVPEEAAPLLQGVEWLDRIWRFPRIRGRLNLGASLPMIRQLRRERFAVSVDLVGNDRGALLSLMVGAKRRIGVIAPEGFYLRSRCYTDRVEPFDTTRHESVRAWAVTAPLGVSFPENMTLEIAADPQRASAAAEALGDTQMLCYVTATLPKREWPIDYWLQFAERARALTPAIVFTGGSSPREKQVLAAIAERKTSVAILPAPEPLELLLAVLAQAKLFVTGDTGPMHFAAALGVPTLSLFGPTSAMRWAPLGTRHRWIQGGLCPCSGHAAICIAANPCVRQITPDRVYDEYARMVLEAPGLTPTAGAQRLR